jgi:integrase
MPSRPVNQEDFKRIKDWLSNPKHRYNKRNLLIWMLGCYCGYRVNEILSLTISSVMKHPPKINTRMTVPRSIMKGKWESRSIIIHPNLKKYIEDYFEAWDDLYGSHKINVSVNKHDPNCPLFPSRKTSIDKTGTHTVKRMTTRNLMKIFEDCAKELQLEDFSTHSMRKNFAQRCYENFDKDLVMLQKALGHRQINSTRHYLNFEDTKVEDGIMKLNFED